MKSTWCLAITFVLTASAAGAQGQMGGQKISLAMGLQRSYAGIKANLTAAAEKLEEADYTYRPSPEIRPFGAQFAHTANSQFNACAAAKGEPSPNAGSNLEQTKTTRADIIKALADSFAVLRPGVCGADRPERPGDGEAGTERNRARRRAGQPRRAQQRGVRRHHRLPADQEHRAAVDRARTRHGKGAVIRGPRLTDAAFDGRASGSAAPG